MKKKITITKNWVSMCKFVNDCLLHLRILGARVSSYTFIKSRPTFYNNNFIKLIYNEHKLSFQKWSSGAFCGLSVRMRFMYHFIFPIRIKKELPHIFLCCHLLVALWCRCYSSNVLEHMWKITGDTKEIKIQNIRARDREKNGFF